MVVVQVPLDLLEQLRAQGLTLHPDLRLEPMPPLARALHQALPLERLARLDRQIQELEKVPVLWSPPHLSLAKLEKKAKAQKARKKSRAKKASKKRR